MLLFQGTKYPTPMTSRITYNTCASSFTVTSKGLVTQHTDYYSCIKSILSVMKGVFLGQSIYNLHMLIPHHVYMTCSGVHVMLVPNRFMSCWYHIRCACHVGTPSGVHDMLVPHHVDTTPGVHVMLVPHQVCMSCWYHIRCTCHVCTTSGVHVMLVPHQVYMLCWYHIRCRAHAGTECRRYSYLRYWNTKSRNNL